MKDWDRLLDIVGVSSSVGISFWVAHDAFGFSFSMADLKLLKEVKSLPKLSLASSHLENFDWEESLEDFFRGRPLQQSEIYYAEKTLTNDVFIGGLIMTKNFFVGHRAI